MTCSVCGGSGVVPDNGAGGTSDVVRTCRACTPQPNPPEVNWTQGRWLPCAPEAIHDAFPNSTLKGPLRFKWPIDNQS